MQEYSSGIRDVKFGEHVRIVHPCNLYECTIGDESFIGPFVEIQRGVVLGRGCKIQSHSFICEGVTIGDNCFIGHGVMFINDTFAGGRPAGDPGLWKPTVVGNSVSIGSNATILPVTICDDAVIGAGAVVTKDITIPGVYAGNPAAGYDDPHPGFHSINLFVLHNIRKMCIFGALKSLYGKSGPEKRSGKDITQNHGRYCRSKAA